MKINYTIEVTDKRAAELLCTAFEGGVGYWLQIMDYVHPENPVSILDADKDPDSATIFKYADYPVQEGGIVVCRITEEDCTDDNYKPLRLDRAAVERGLQVMAEKYPTHFANFINENDDAETGDVFMQCALLGEIVYG